MSVRLIPGKFWMGPGIGASEMFGAGGGGAWASGRSCFKLNGPRSSGRSISFCRTCGRSRTSPRNTAGTTFSMPLTLVSASVSPAGAIPSGLAPLSGDGALGPAPSVPGAAAFPSRARPRLEILATWALLKAPRGTSERSKTVSVMKVARIRRLMSASQIVPARLSTHPRTSQGDSSTETMACATPFLREGLPAERERMVRRVSADHPPAEGATAAGAHPTSPSLPPAEPIGSSR